MGWVLLIHILFPLNVPIKVLSMANLFNMNSITPAQDLATSSGSIPTPQPRGGKRLNFEPRSLDPSSTSIPTPGGDRLYFEPTPAQDLPASTPPPRGGERLYLEQPILFPAAKRQKIGHFTTFRTYIPDPAL
jgi:hypothetical protein